MHQTQQEDEKTRTNSKDPGKSQRCKEHFQYQISEEANPHPKVKNKEGEAVKTRQGIANVFAKFYEDLYEGEVGYTEEDMDSRTDDEKNTSQPTQLHPRVYKK